METGNFLPKNGYGWIWGTFYQKIRIWMDTDPAERGGMEWVSEFCPVKGSSPDPRTFENRVGGPPRFENEVAKIRCFFRFLGYFGLGWPPCRRFYPPLKNP